MRSVRGVNVMILGSMVIWEWVFKCVGKGKIAGFMLGFGDNTVFNRVKLGRRSCGINMMRSLKMGNRA